MKRLVLLAAIRCFAVPCAAETGGERVFRLGHIAPSKLSLDFARQATMPERAKLGFVEGRNLVVIERYGDAAALPRLVEELLQAKPDAIVASGPEVVRAASAAAKTVPIVGFGPDVMLLGIAATQNRPGGNVTGVVILAPQQSFTAHAAQLAASGCTGRILRFAQDDGSARRVRALSRYLASWKMMPSVNRSPLRRRLTPWRILTR